MSADGAACLVATWADSPPGRARTLGPMPGHGSSRRSLVSLLCSGAIGALVLGCKPATQGKKVGLLEHGSTKHEENARELAAHLRRYGWIEGENLEIVHRVYGDEVTRIAGIIGKLEALGVEVVVVDHATLDFARYVRTTMPIVCYEIFDALGQGLTRTLAAPSGNVTGISWQSDETAGKRLEIAVELVPRLRRLALIAADDAQGAVEAYSMRMAAAGIGVSLTVYPLRREYEARSDVFREIVRDRPEVLLIAASQVTFEYLDEILGFALFNRLPTISELSFFARKGVLATYGPDLDEMLGLSAGQVDKILRGARVREVPFQQPTRFGLVINQRIAREIGLKLPPSMLARATEVID